MFYIPSLETSYDDLVWGTNQNVTHNFLIRIHRKPFFVQQKSGLEQHKYIIAEMLFLRKLL